ncbi:MAG TPA: FliH/SctL family protein [candidate division Zixibacteria bacterium]|nr:FliH/SctL family protein [candidate division Zixibacteria bacterium]
MLRVRSLAEPLKIGQIREDADLSATAADILARRYPDVHIETGLDGKRWMALKEMVRVDARVNELMRSEYERGRSAGEASGLERGRGEARQALDAFEGAVCDAVQQRETLLRDAESNIIELILKIARKLTFDAVRLDPDITAQIVRGAIESLVDKREIAVQVHPDHLPQLEQVMDEFESLSTEIRKISLQPDARVGHGGCFIRTPSGDIDARLESQFQIIEETVRKDR